MDTTTPVLVQDGSTTDLKWFERLANWLKSREWGFYNYGQWQPAPVQSRKEENGN